MVAGLDRVLARHDFGAMLDRVAEALEPGKGNLLHDGFCKT